MEWGRTHVSRHVRQSSNPFVRIEIYVAEPGITICQTAALHCFWDMIIKVDVDILCCQSGSHGIEDLGRFRIPSFQLKLYLKTSERIVTCNLVVFSANCGLLSIIFANAVVPLLSQSPGQVSPMSVTSPRLSKIQSTISIAKVSQTVLNLVSEIFCTIFAIDWLLCP
jgi:hypothetical protein